MAFVDHTHTTPPVYITHSLSLRASACHSHLARKRPQRGVGRGNQHEVGERKEALAANAWCFALGDDGSQQLPAADHDSQHYGADRFEHELAIEVTS